MIGDIIDFKTRLKNKTFKEKVKSFFMRLGYSFFHYKHSLLEGIKSYWRWRKIIWNDRTWGYSELIKIMVFKLKMDAIFFEKRDHLESSLEKAAQMREVADLLEKFLNDPYTWNAHNRHKEKWGDDKIYFVELANGDYEMKSERDDRLNSTEKAEERADYKKLMDAAIKEKNDDLKKALQIMQENLERWWD